MMFITKRFENYEVEIANLAFLLSHPNRSYCLLPVSFSPCIQYLYPIKEFLYGSSNQKSWIFGEYEISIGKAQ